MDSAFLDHGGSLRLVGVGGVPGANHSVRVNVLRQVGGYDENYNVGAAIREESDLAARLLKRGHRIDFDPEAWLVHLAVTTGGCRAKSEWTCWMRSFSQLYFAFRHLYPGYWFWEQLCFRIPRSYVFCRQNILRPWRLPRAVAAYVEATVRADRLARREQKVEARTDGRCGSHGGPGEPVH
jgi:GT2 family glycosyltransferase